MSSSSGLSLAGEEVRVHDPDRFLTALFAPDDRREDLFALYAFNAEVARVREIVSEPVLGHMRLQWWRESLHGEARGSTPPLAQALLAAIQRHALPLDLFEALIDARASLLDTPEMPDAEALDAYVEATGGGLTRLAWRVVGGEGPEGEHAAQHAGIAYAMVGLLRSAASEAMVGRASLPGLDLTDKAASASLAAEVAEEAQGHLAAARRHLARPGRARVAPFLPLVIAEGALKRLRRGGYDLLDQTLTLPLRRPLAMAIRAWRGVY